MVTIHDPGQDRLINELYVWVLVDPATGLEGIAALIVGPNVPMQAVTSSRELANEMRAHWVTLSKLTGKKFKLVRFKTKEVLEEI